MEKRKINSNDIKERFTFFADNLKCHFNGFSFPFKVITVGENDFFSMMKSVNYTSKNCFAIFNKMKKEFIPIAQRGLIDKLDEFIRFPCSVNGGLSVLTIEFSTGKKGFTELYILVGIDNKFIGLMSERCYLENV